MIRPRLRLYVCASAVAVTLSGAVLTQAAGPGEFISNLWNRKPAPKKEVARSLNPFKWLSREKSDSTVRRVEVSDGGESVVSQRPELVRDPFLTERLPRTDTPGAPGSKGVIVRPQPRQRPVTNQTVDLESALRERKSSGSADNVGRRGIAGAPTADASNRATAVAQQPLPEVKTAPQRPTGNGQFVNGFDSEFQKLFKEVIEESRQSKAKAATPRLPDEAVADFKPPGAASLPEVVTTDTDYLKNDFAEIAKERGSSNVDQLIEQSRRQMDSSLLARRASDDRSSRQSTPGRSVSEPANDSSTGLSAVSHSDSNSGAATTSPVATTGSESQFMLQMLPDRTPPQTVNDLVVPSSKVPERQLFTDSDGWMNRGDLERPAAPQNAPAPDLQPVVRVVPGHRGAGVVIESGQWSPVQPRVSSNVAPARSVPDTSQFRRLSFEGANASAPGGAVQAISDGSQDQASLSTNSPHAGQSTMMIPASSDDTVSSVPSSLTADTDSSDELAMIIPDSRTGQSLDAAKLGAAFDAAPAPPRISEPVFEWPDETEVAAEAASGGFSWGATLFFLTLVGGSIGLFFRRKAQDGVFGITGTGTESEIS
ncbi:MAG: hypothetical protein ACI8P0_001940 [Planctomycetaceae bacterium]|jgi:hypothetical protein